MRVEILEEKLRDSDAESGQSFNLGKGDIITVSDETGTKWCELGWAKDVDGVVATGERIPGARMLEPQNAKSGAPRQGE